MALEIHEDCKRRLREFLAASLHEMQINHGIFLDFESLKTLEKGDLILPTKGKAADEIKSYVDDTPFSTFIDHTISRDLAVFGEFEDGLRAHLSEITGYQDLSQASSRLVDTFASLPNRYTYTMELPPNLDGMIPKDQNEFTIGDSFRLVRVTQDFKSKYQLSTGISEFDWRIHRPRSLVDSVDGYAIWKDNTLCMQRIGKGFSGWSEKLNTDLLAEADFKAFLGICLAMGLTRYDYRWRAQHVSQHYYVHRQDENIRTIERGWDAEQSLSDVVPHLAIADVTDQFHDERGTERWKIRTLSQVRVCFVEQEASRRIRLAGQWLLDSYSSHNNLLGFVQAVVCLEILLGEPDAQDDIGLSALLRNRCAYLIGRSQKQREDILKDFSEIYKVRSKIVHAGKSNLSRNEKFMLYRLRFLCSSAIKEEVKLVAANALHYIENARL